MVNSEQSVARHLRRLAQKAALSRRSDRTKGQRGCLSRTHHVPAGRTLRRLSSFSLAPSRDGALCAASLSMDQCEAGSVQQRDRTMAAGSVRAMLPALLDCFNLMLSVRQSSENKYLSAERSSQSSAANLGLRVLVEAQRLVRLVGRDLVGRCSSTVQHTLCVRMGDRVSTPRFYRGPRIAQPHGSRESSCRFPRRAGELRENGSSIQAPVPSTLLARSVEGWQRSLHALTEPASINRWARQRPPSTPVSPSLTRFESPFTINHIALRHACAHRAAAPLRRCTRGRPLRPSARPARTGRPASS